MASSPTQIDLYRRFLGYSRRSAAVYSTMARLEKDDERAAVFTRLASNEIKHARRCAELIGQEVRNVRPARIGAASIVLWVVARIIGTAFVAKFLVRGHGQKLHEVAQLDDPSVIADTAREQGDALRRLAYPDAQAGGHEHHEGGFLAGEGGTLRAAVLGVNDGLVSNFSLVMGVAAGTGDAGIVMLAGVAGLLAGAFSMAAGEYISMRSQRDVYENLVRLERAELELWPDEEREELAEAYRAKGLTDEEAETISMRISMQPDVALDTHLREEFGLNREDLGAPWAAAMSSMVAFSLGAIVPLLPYLFGENDLSFMLSGAFSAAALVTVGAGLAWMSGVNWLWGAARMLLVGSAAAAVTFGIGSAIGRAIS